MPNFVISNATPDLKSCFHTGMQPDQGVHHNSPTGPARPGLTTFPPQAALNFFASQSLLQDRFQEIFSRYLTCEQCPCLTWILPQDLIEAHKIICDLPEHYASTGNLSHELPFHSRPAGRTQTGILLSIEVPAPGPLSGHPHFQCQQTNEADSRRSQAALSFPAADSRASAPSEK